MPCTHLPAAPLQQPLSLWLARGPAMGGGIRRNDGRRNQKEDGMHAMKHYSVAATLGRSTSTQCRWDTCPRCTVEHHNATNCEHPLSCHTCAQLITSVSTSNSRLSSLARSSGTCLVGAVKHGCQV